jgi:hypothetical protein
MTMAAMTADLARDLYANLCGQLRDVPWPRRPRSCWVMSLEWWNECRKIGDFPPDPRVAPAVPFTAQETMLGLPVHVTGDGGFPHLIAD